MRNPLIAKLGKAVRANGNAAISRAVPVAHGSTAANAANGGAAPGAGQKKPGYHPLRVLKNLPNGELTPQQQAAYARAISVLETRPAIHGYKEIAKQLAGERESTAKGLGTLGSGLQGGVTDVYKNIAESEAQNLARQSQLGQQLNQQSASIATSGAKQLAGMQEGALGDYEKQLEMRGAPGGGGAQQQLANAVASQQATQNADSQAAQQFAASQGSSYGALASQMAGAAQMQGGAAVGQIGRDILSRVGQSNQKYNENIQTALGKLGEAKASYGPTFAKNLGVVHGEQQKFRLGQEAVQGNKAQLAAEKEQAAAANKTKQGENATANKQQQFENAVELKKLGLAQWEAHHPNASSSETHKAAKALQKEVSNVKSIIGQLVGEAKAAEKEGHKGIAGNFAAYVANANKILGEEQAEPQVIRRVLKHWWVNKAKQQGNRGLPNTTKVPYAP
jgi:hypothetical protein